MDYSLGLLKPDCIERDLIDTVLDIVRAEGLDIVLTKQLRLNQDLIDLFYPQCKPHSYYQGLCEHLLSGPVFVYIVRGEGAIARLNRVVGINDPSKSPEGTIRNMGQDIRRNLAHSSENFDQFFREAVMIFSKEEIVGLLQHV